MNTIYLDPAMVPASLRGTYSGKSFKAVVCETVNIPVDAGLWSGGSRDHYSAVELATGQRALLPGQDKSPFERRGGDGEVTLKAGFAIVCHTMFCGKDLGLTFYVHPANAATMLPAPAADLTPHERLVIEATCSLKSSYAGKDRYENAQREYNCTKALGDTPYPTREQWDTAKAALIARGMLNKAGAVTPAGRNARR